MTQYIAPNMAAAMQYSNRQGMMPSNQYASGILGLKHGGRARFKKGGGRIGGGRIKGTPMPGGRTGFWNPFEAASDFVGGILETPKKLVKKLVPKELAGIMQMAAPFVAPGNPWGAAAMSALGQYKQRGKINPLQLAMSTAPGWTNQGVANLASKIPGLSDQRVSQFTDWLGRGDDMTGGTGNFLRSLLGQTDTGIDIDETLFMDGILGEDNEYMGPVNLLKKGVKGLVTDKEGDIDKRTIIALGIGGMSYVEANKQMNLMGKGDLETEYGITEDDWEATDWSGWAKGTHLESAAGNAQGGLPRIRHAMGSAQFPPQKRTGLQWGSDKGEGLGGEEVEADMRYTGGFMPYGDKPKADDVPARLSKDEFVFTDEAVAGMGEGDVNLGAERLYNMMKNLEQQGAPGQMGIGAIV
jgi:hypothetical protein